MPVQLAAPNTTCSMVVGVLCHSLRTPSRVGAVLNRSAVTVLPLGRASWEARVGVSGGDSGGVPVPGKKAVGLALTGVVGDPAKSGVGEGVLPTVGATSAVRVRSGVGKLKGVGEALPGSVQATRVRIRTSAGNRRACGDMFSSRPRPRGDCTTLRATASGGAGGSRTHTRDSLRG